MSDPGFTHSCWKKRGIASGNTAELGLPRRTPRCHKAGTPRPLNHPRLETTDERPKTKPQSAVTPAGLHQARAPKLTMATIRFLKVSNRSFRWSDTVTSIK